MLDAVMTVNKPFLCRIRVRISYASAIVVPLPHLKLPPLNAVRAFEAAARQSSFRLAAEELFVTPGAVSQQIRLLEGYFGVALFERLPRAVRLTPTGQEFFSGVTKHLRGIAQASERVRPRGDQVLVTVSPDFASRWLVPRLAEFMQRHPTVEVRVDASFVLADFERDSFDLGIRYGLHLDRQDDARVEGLLLFKQRVVPFCSPAYRARHFDGVPAATAWRTVRLLHENPPFDLWPQWLARQGYTELDAGAGLYFSHGLLAVPAAIGGEGVTLQPREYVERDLRTGALVAADAAEFVSGRGYYLVWPKRPLRAAAIWFRDWILEAVSETATTQLAARD